MLTTLDRVKSELRQKNNSRVVATDEDEQYVIQRIPQVQRVIERYTDRLFAPVKMTVGYDALTMDEGGLVNGGYLYLEHDPLQLDSVSLFGTTAQPSSYRLLPSGDQPKTALYFEDEAVLRGNGLSVVEAVRLTGIFAYRSRPSEGWIDSGDTVRDNPLSASASTITVEDSAGEDGLLNTPRFSPGQLLRLESEYVYVRDVNVAGTPAVHTLRVVRGVNGTTKATHTQGTSIEIWEPEPDIARSATRLAAFMYQRQGEFIKTQVDGMTAKEWPESLPDDVREILDDYIRAVRPLVP